MLTLGFEAQARAFFSEHRHFHAQLHEEDVLALETLTADTLRTGTAGATYRSGRFELRVHHEPFSLLMHFLRDNAFQLVMALLSQRVTVHLHLGPLEPHVRAPLYRFTQAASQEHGRPPLRCGVYYRPAPEAPPTPVPVGIASAKLQEVALEALLPSLGPAERDQLPRDVRELAPVVSADKRQKLSDSVLLRAPSCCLLTMLNARDGVACMVASPDLRAVAAGFGDSSVKVWDLAPRAMNDRDGLPPRRLEPGYNHQCLIGHSGPVYSVAWTPCSRYLVSGSADGTARLWDTVLGAGVSVYRDHRQPIWSVAFNPVGVYFATASADGTARLWSTHSAHQLRMFAGHVGDVHVVSWHRNGNLLATAGVDKSVRLWEAATGKQVRSFVAHTGSVYAVAFSRDGRIMASAGEDRTIVLHDLATFACLCTLAGHEKRIWSLDFCHEDCFLVSGSADLTVRVWDTKKAVQPAALPPGEMPATSIPSSVALYRTYATKNTPVFDVRFTSTNLVIATGAFKPPTSKTAGGGEGMGPSATPSKN